MSVVDFTLEDVRKLIHDEREHTQSLFEREREHTKQMIKESAEDVKHVVVDEFLSFWDSNLGPAFDEVHADIAELRHDVAILARAQN